jgi:hypothetical protein
VPLLAPSGSTITLTVTATALPLNGTTQIVAQVLEAAGTPPQDGTLVVFTTSMGSVQPPEAQTKGGRVTVIFNAGTSNGTATITASSGGASASGANAAKIAIGTAAVGSVRLAANPTLLPALGGSSTITATVIDINGNPLSSAPISFSTTAGVLDQATISTDQNGAATAVLRTSTTATVTAAVGAQAGSSTTTPPAAGAPATPTPSTSGTASGTVTVNVASAPTLLITPPATGLTVGLPGTFTFAVTAAATNGSPIRDVTVSWGDGQSQDLGAVTGTISVTHVYRSAGSFVVIGNVIDSSGNPVSTSTSVTVTPPLLTLIITPPATLPSANLPANFTFAATAPAGDAVRNVSINWGDGSAAQDLGAITGTVTVGHVYKTAANYVISGTVTDINGVSSTVSTSITVIPVPRPTIIITPSPVPGHAGAQTTLSVQVTLANGISVQDLSIDFGDGQHADLGGASSASVPHVYTLPGTYTVTVTVLDSSGQTTTGTTAVSITL